MSSQKIPGKHAWKNFKLGPTIYNHSFFKIVYMRPLLPSYTDT